jgi:hypothetical protein
MVVALIYLLVALGATSAQEVRQEKRPLLDIEGNQIFSKKELLDIVNNQLDEWAKAGSKYNTDQLDYCIHQMKFSMMSRGYLKSEVTKKEIEETKRVRAWCWPWQRDRFFAWARPAATGSDFFPRS